MKRYVILGGNGVFGVHTAKYLLDQTDTARVICVGRNTEKAEPFSLAVGKGDPRYSYRQIHIVYEHDRLLEMLDIETPEVIVNFAAQGEGAVSWKNSWRFFDTNATALARLAEELGKRSWLERFIQIGTSELYGSNGCAVVEADSIRPSSPYAASKAAFDLYLIAVHRALGFPMNILRPCNCYGPGQLLHRVIPKAIVCGLTGRKLPLDGGGKAEKSYMHARDLARAIYLVAKSAPLGAVYNAGPNRPTAIREVVERCAAALDIEFDELCEMAPERLGQDSRYWLDSSAIRSELGWAPEIQWDDGLSEMVAWGTRYLDQLREWPMTYELRA